MYTYAEIYMKSLGFCVSNHLLQGTTRGIPTFLVLIWLSIDTSRVLICGCSRKAIIYVTNQQYSLTYHDEKNKMR